MSRRTGRRRCRGSGATLTSYIYYASPAGEGNDRSAALSAALVLIVLMLLVNAAIALRLAEGRVEALRSARPASWQSATSPFATGSVEVAARDLARVGPTHRVGAIVGPSGLRQDDAAARAEPARRD